MAEREQWGSVRLSFEVGDDTNTFVSRVYLWDGDDILDAIERAGVSLVNSLARDAARRKQGSIVDETVARLNGVAS